MADSASEQYCYTTPTLIEERYLKVYDVNKKDNVNSTTTSNNNSQGNVWCKILFSFSVSGKKVWDTDRYSVIHSIISTEFKFTVNFIILVNMFHSKSVSVESFFFF